jgi:hypothetical protein
LNKKDYVSLEHEKRKWILQRWATRMQINYFLADRFLHHFSFKELSRCFILEDRENGKSLKQLSIKYRLSMREVRTICDYKKKKVNNKLKNIV